MGSASRDPALREAIERLSRPLETPEDLIGLGVTLDVLATGLLKSELAPGRLSDAREGMLSGMPPDVSEILRGTDSELLAAAADAAELLAGVPTASVLTAEEVNAVVDEAERNRQKLYDSLKPAFGGAEEDN